MSSREWQHFCRLFKRICARWGFNKRQFDQEAETNDANVRLSDLYDDVSQTLSPFEAHELNGIRQHVSPKNDDIDLVDEGIVIFLEPPSVYGLGRKQFPVLTIQASKNASRPSAKIVAAFFTRGDDESVKCSGYRFETIGGGTHKYAHVQGTKKWSSSEEEILPGVAEWRPVQSPAFPLDAECSVQVLLCLLVSIYGVNALTDLKEDQVYSHVTSYLERMHIPGQLPVAE